MYFCGKHLVGLAGIGVLLLDEARHTETMSCVEGGSAGVSTYSYGHVRLEGADDTLGHELAAQEVNDDTDVLQ